MSSINHSILNLLTSNFNESQEMERFFEGLDIIRKHQEKIYQKLKIIDQESDQNEQFIQKKFSKFEEKSIEFDDASTLDVLVEEENKDENQYITSLDTYINSLVLKCCEEIRKKIEINSYCLNKNHNKYSLSLKFSEKIKKDETLNDIIEPIETIFSANHIEFKKRYFVFQNENKGIFQFQILREKKIKTLKTVVETALEINDLILSAVDVEITDFNWNYFFNKQDLKRDWDYKQPFEINDNVKKYIINGSINHYKHKTIFSKVISKIRIHTSRTDREKNYLILCLDNLNKEKIEILFRFLFENKSFESNKFDFLFPKFYIEALESKKILEKLKENRLISKYDYKKVKPFIKELERSFEYARECKNEITLDQQEFLETLLEPYLEKLKDVNFTKLKELINWTSTLIIHKGLKKTKKFLLRYFIKKVGGETIQNFYEFLGFIPEKIFYENLIAFSQIYSSLADLEDKLTKNFSSLPSKEIMQKFMLSLIIKKQYKNEIDNSASSNLEIILNKIEKKEQLYSGIWCLSNEHGTIQEISFEEKSLPYWRLFLKNNENDIEIHWDEKKERKSTFKNLFHWLVNHQTIGLLVSSINNLH